MPFCAAAIDSSDGAAASDSQRGGIGQLVNGIAEHDWSQPNPSIFNGETLPDFIYSLVQRIKSGVKASVVKVKYVPTSEKSETPVMSFHVDETLLAPLPACNNTD